MSTPLTLIGLGPMGRAMVAEFLGRGHPVTVWNRTASRADDLVAAGAARAATPRDAVAANRLVLLSLTDYRAMHDVLAGVELAGKVVVNLSSDTPDKTAEAAAWLAERGAELLVGGVMVPAPAIGTDASYVFYSGPSAVFEEHRDVLAVIGRPEYVGEDHSLAQLHYQALLDFFLTALSGLLHAFALVGSAGVPAGRLAPFLVDNAGLLASLVEESAGHVDRGEHPGELADAVMMGASADHVVGASESAGLDPALPRVVRDQYRRVIAAGRGRESWTAIYDVIKPAK